MAVFKRNEEHQTGLTSSRLKILITIVARNKADFYMDLIQSAEVNMQFVAMAEGASNPNVRYLALSDTEKAVIFSVIREDRENEMLELLDEKFRTIRNGKGIAYTIPMDSVIGVTLYGFLSNNEKIGGTGNG